RILAPQRDQVPMQIAKLAVFLAICPIKFATIEGLYFIRHCQSGLHILGSCRWELRQKFKAAFLHRLSQLFVADLAEIKKRRGSAKLFALKKQRSPRTKQK